MTSTGALFVIIALVIGGFVGWHARTARGANADLKLYKARIPGLRRARTRSGLVSLTCLVITLLVVYDLLR